MIIDGRTTAEPPWPDCDVLIVGSGPAGITLALELEAAGLSCVLLESGGLEFDAEVQELNDGTVTGRDNIDLAGMRLRLFGGTSNHWAGYCVPLDRIDFERAPLSGLTGWPVSHDDLLPHYAVANGYCEVGAFGYDLGDLAGADLLAPGGGLEARMLRESPPTHFGEVYRDRISASRTIQLWLWTTATGVEIDATGTATAVLARTITGEARRFVAREVVLAGGAVENARFLLANNARLGARFGNRGGWLGACYMDHPVGGAGFLYLDPPVPPKAEWSGDVRTRDGIDARLVWRLSDEILRAERLGNIHFYLLPYSADDAARQRRRAAQEGMRGLRNVAKWVLGRNREKLRLSDEYCRFITNADALAGRAWQEGTGGERTDRLLLQYESEQFPSRDSYVSLDEDYRDRFGDPRAAVHWSPGLDDRDAILRSAVEIGRILGAAGIGRLELEDHFDARYWDAHTGWHQLGTTRMAVSESDGVTDPDGRVHGTANLYVAGGSLFPQGGRANPTLTIVALSVRLAAHLRGKRGV